MTSDLEKSKPENSGRPAARVSSADRAATKLAKAQDQLRAAKRRQRAALDHQAQTIGYECLEAALVDPEFANVLLKALARHASPEGHAELLSVLSGSTDKGVK